MQARKKLAQKHGLRRARRRHGRRRPGVLAKAQEPHRVRLDLGRGRSAAARRRLLHGAHGRRRAAAGGRALCRAVARRYRLCATSAPSARRSTRGWRRSAASAPPTASTSTSTSPSRPPSGRKGALTKLAPADAAATATVVHVDFKGAGRPRRRRAGVHGREPARGRDHGARQSQRHRLDARDLARRARHRCAGLRLQAGRLPSASCPRTMPGSRCELAEAVGLGARRRRRAQAARELRHDDAVALAGRGLRQAHRPHGCGEARRRRRPSPISPPTASSSTCSRPFPRSSPPSSCSELLRPLPGRLYSVASSLAAHPGEAHLLVGAVRWESHGKKRKGVTSTYLADRRKMGDTVAHLREAQPPLPLAGGRRRVRSS